jgi:hypothetical protein
MKSSEALRIFDIDSTHSYTMDEFKKLYRKTAKSLHPDNTSGDTKMFVRLKEAFDYLMEFGEFSIGTSFTETNELVTTDLGTLSVLTREELMKRYKHDRGVLEKQLHVYQRSLHDQELALNEVKTVVQHLMSDFEDEKQKLQHSLDSRISELENRFKPTLLQKILFFLPRMSKKEFWDEYNDSVSQYTKKYEALNLSFFKILVATYGEGLNTITLTLEDSKQKN